MYLYVSMYYYSPSFRRMIAYHYIISIEEKNYKRKLAYNRVQNLSKYSWRVVLPVYFCGLLAVIFYFSIYIGSKSSAFWLGTLFIALLEDILCIQLLKIFLKWIYIPRSAINEIYALYKMMTVRMRTIINRLVLCTYIHTYVNDLTLRGNVL